MDDSSAFRVLLLVLVSTLLGISQTLVADDDYIWVVKDPEIQDNIPPPNDDYEANRDRDEAQETLDRIAEEQRRAADRLP